MTLSIFLNEKLRSTSQQQKLTAFPNQREKEESEVRTTEFSDLQLRFLSSVVGCRHPVLREVAGIQHVSDCCYTHEILI